MDNYILWRVGKKNRILVEKFKNNKLRRVRRVRKTIEFK